MSKVDITQEIARLHEERLMEEAIQEVKKELAEGVPIEVQREVNKLLSQIETPTSVDSDNVIAFAPKSARPQSYTIGETELLAAAGPTLADWFAQPISLGGAGFVLDVRRVIGSVDEVDIYLNPNNDSSEQMQKTLRDFVGKTIRLIVSNNQEQLLDAILYIDEAGNAAEGSGKLVERKGDMSIKGKISISIIVDSEGDY